MRHRVPGKLFLAVAVAFSFLVSPVAAQKPKLIGPVGVVNLSSIDGLLDDVDYIFASVNRPELSQIVVGALATVGNLKGMDRKKPLGLLVYLQPGEGKPEPVFIGYVPVTNIADLQRTVQLGPIRMIKEEEKENRYRIQVEDESVPILVKDGYAFITENEATLEMELPDPAKLAGKLTGQYDLSGSILLAQLPRQLREGVVKEMKKGMERESKQKSSETEAQYKGRLAGTKLVATFAEQVIMQGEDLAFGWNISKQEKEIQLETRLNAQTSSELATTLKKLGSQQSQFGAIASAKAPLTATVTIAVPKEFRDLFVTVLADGEKKVKEDIPPEDQAPVLDLIKTIKTTLESSPYDFALQMNGEPPNPFTLLAATKVGNGKVMGEAIQKIMDIATKKYDVPNLKSSVETVNGVAIHQIIPDDLDEDATSVFGEDAAVYIAVDADTMFVAMGGDAALTDLKTALKTPQKTVTAAKPAQIVFRLASWMTLIAEENDDPEFEKLATKAFAQGGDAIRLELSSQETGARFRLSLEEGFIRMIGLAVVNGLGQ